MKQYLLPPKTLFLWQCRAALAWFVLILFASFFTFSLKTFLITTTVITVILSVVTFWYLPKYFSLCKIKVLKGAVIVESGVIIRTCHILPYSRLIYTQTIVTPLSRFFGLSAVTLKAARSRVYIPEMRTEDMKNFVSQLTKGD